MLSLVTFAGMTLNTVGVQRVFTQSKKEDKDQESIQSSTTPDLGHHMGK